MGRFLQSFVLASALLGSTVSAKANFGAPSDRILRAATKRSDLSRRGGKVETKYGTELAYIEHESTFGHSEIFASQLKVSSNKPVLNLEEIEHHIDDVKCGKDSIKLRFLDDVTKKDAMKACHGGLIVTSHEGCNNEGERAVYKVTDIDNTGKDFTLDLAVVELTWKDAFSTIDITFGHTTDRHLLRRHSDFSKLRRRQADTTSTIPAVTIPTDTPADKKEITFNVSSQLINHTFAPSDFLSGIDNIVNIPDLPVEIGCNNCTTTGNVVLTQGEININTTQIDLVPDFLQGGDDGKSLTDVITGGYFQVTANDLAAHIDLFARPKTSGKFEIGLPGIPIIGFTIPGVGQAGAFFNVSFVADYTVSGGLQVGYGFDVAVPQNSNVKIDLVDLEKSNTTGFPNTTLTPLPFTANVTSIDVQLGLTLKPAIPIGFKFLTKLEADVAVSMNLPRLDLHLKTEKNVDPACNALPSNSTTTKNTTAISSPFTLSNSSLLSSADLNNIIEDLGDLVLVSANVSLSLDVGADFKFPLIPAPLKNSVATDAQIFGTTFTLGTTCLAAKKGYQTASSIWSSATSSLIASKVSASPTLAPYGNNSGLVTPSGTTGGAVQQTSPGEFFTGAAAPIRIGAVSWGFGWQMAVLGVSFVAGMMVML